MKQRGQVTARQDAFHTPHTRHLHVLVAVEHDAHGALEVVRRDRDGRVQEDAARLLAAEAAAQPLGLGDDLVGGDAQHAADILLVLCDRLKQGITVEMRQTQSSCLHRHTLDHVRTCVDETMRNSSFSCGMTHAALVSR